MKLQYKNLTLHHVYMAIVFAVNSSVTVLSLYFKTHDKTFIFAGIGLFALSLFDGILQVRVEIGNGEKQYYTIAITIVEYLVLFFISCVVIYWLVTVKVFIGVILLLILVPIEAVVIPIISYRYRIKNKIIACFKKQKKKGEL